MWAEKSATSSETLCADVLSEDILPRRLRFAGLPLFRFGFSGAAHKSVDLRLPLMGFRIVGPQIGGFVEIAQRIGVLVLCQAFSPERQCGCEKKIGNLGILPV